MSKELVQDPQALAEICELIATSEFVALDTEFIRQSTYRPQLCLIQIALGEEIFCLDPLALTDLEILMQALANTCVVIHSARQDIEAIFQSTDTMLSRIFDTQIAAGLTGYGDQVSYSALVKAVMNVELGKGETRTNWAQRPLSAAQLRYAKDDVRYLLQLYQPLHEALENKQRTEWHTKECKALLKEKLYTPDIEQAWKRVKGTRTLSRSQRRIMKRLASWREQAATERDKPRKWIMSDLDIVKIAGSEAQSEQEILELFDTNQKFLRHQSSTFWALYQAAEDDPLEEAYERADAREIRLTKLCMADLRQTAEELGLSASLLGTRKDVIRAIHAKQSVLMESWRYELIGKKLQRTIDSYQE